MGWERRRRGRYYYRSTRVRGRVSKRYVGGGALGQWAAQEDARERAERGSKRREQAAERARMLGEERELQELYERVEAAIAASLAAAGYHRHDRGPWRRRRTRGEAS